MTTVQLTGISPADDVTSTTQPSPAEAFPAADPNWRPANPSAEAPAKPAAPGFDLNAAEIGGGLGAASLGGVAYLLTKEKEKRTRLLAVLGSMLAGGGIGAYLGNDYVKVKK